MHGNQNLLWKHSVFNENLVSEDFLESRVEFLIKMSENNSKAHSDPFSASPTGALTAARNLSWHGGTGTSPGCEIGREPGLCSPALRRGLWG